MAKKRHIDDAQLRVLRKGLVKHLGIDVDSALAKKKKKKEDEPVDPDEELAATKKIERKGFASSVSRS